MRNYRSLLVPLDGSTFAEQALLYVEPLALDAEATITLLCVTTSWTALVARSTPGDITIHSRMYTPRPEDLAMIFEVEREAALAYLRSLADRLRSRGLLVRYEQRSGAPATVIIQQALELRTDMIAMTTHGRGGLRRLLRGSVADDVARSAPCPVMLVRGGEQPPNQARVLDAREFETRLVPMAHS